jgi:hypothetical protein
VEVSSTDPVFISRHKQLLLTSQGNMGNKNIITSTTVMKKWKYRYVLCWGGGGDIHACAHRHVHACLLVSVYNVRIQIALKSKSFVSVSIGNWILLKLTDFFFFLIRCHISDYFKWKWSRQF